MTVDLKKLKCGNLYLLRRRVLASVSLMGVAHRPRFFRQRLGFRSLSGGHRRVAAKQSQP